MDESLKTFVFRFRLPIILLLNLFLHAASYFLAIGLRFDFSWEWIFKPHYYLLPIPLLLLFRTSSYIFFGLNRGYWRYASAPELLNLLKAHAASSLLFMAAVGMLRLPDYPRSVIIIEWVLSILFCGGSRFLVRLWCERVITQQAVSSITGLREVIVLGAGASGHMLIKLLLGNQLRYRPVAVLDDSERMQSATVHGIPVLGSLARLEYFLDKLPRVSAVVIAIPSLSSTKVEEIRSICRSHDVALKELQSFEDIACTDADEAHERLSIESLLEKQVHIEHEDEIRQALHGKRVLITGAGGSIGAELVRQVLHFAPEKVVLVDHSEFNLFSIDRELNEQHEVSPRSCYLANVKDESRLVSIFRAEKPQVVFHAAAYKHVPLLETNCCEALANNVIGTKNLLNVSKLFQAERFVLISTDKAVDPSSVMGCSKRIAELLVRQFAEGSAGGTASGMSTAVVRFGNVINSAGSVIPLFKEQILGGGPITVTHPDMERYFMSIREAVRLVLTAGTLGQNGEIYILDMGKPIKIVDVARKMRVLYGRRDIPIIFTGIRPGEKLTEKLTNRVEQTGPTRFKKVQRVTYQDLPKQDVLRWVAELEDQLMVLDNSQVLTRIHEYVRGHAGIELEESSQREKRLLQ